MLTVYSKSNCPFCDKAKHLLTTKNINFETVNIEQDTDARQWLVEQGHRSVPQIYKNGSLFVEGGFQGLSKLSDEELNERLSS